MNIIRSKPNLIDPDACTMSDLGEYLQKCAGNMSIDRHKWMQKNQNRIQALQGTGILVLLIMISK